MKSRFDLPPESTIGTRLKAERLRLGFSQAEAARRLGVKRTWWSLFERDIGVQELRITDLKNMSRWGADVAFIISGERTSGAANERLSFAFATIRQTLAALTPKDRHRILLDLMSGEFNA